MATFNGNAGQNDSFIGTGGLNDTFNFRTIDLTGADTVDGGRGAGTIDVDTLVLTTGGAISAARFAGVIRIEKIVLAGAGNDVTLTSTMFSRRADIVGGNGNDRVDASLLTGPGGIGIDVTAGLGADTILGSARADTFRFTANGLTGADIVTGGSGIDHLVLTTAGTITTADLAQVTGIQKVTLAAGNNRFDADLDMFDAGNFSVDGSSGNDSIELVGDKLYDGARVSAGSGNDTLIGADGSESFVFAIADFDAQDVVTGNGEAGVRDDAIVFTTSGAVTAATFTGVSGIEELYFGDGDDAVTVNDALVATARFRSLQISAGDGDDRIDASALTGTNRVVVFARDGDDTLIGGAGDDRFSFGIQSFNANDHVDGGAGIDTLTLAENILADPNLPANAFANVTGIERIEISTRVATPVILTEALLDGSSTGSMTVRGSVQADFFDGAAVGAGHTLRFEGAGSLNGAGDTLIGGAGADTFTFGDRDFDAADSVSGGGGADVLEIFGSTNPRLVAASAFENVFGIEQLSLLGSVGVNVGLSDVLVDRAGGTLVILGRGGAETVDGSGILDAAHRLDFTAGGDGFASDGTPPGDSFIGGAGDDIVRVRHFELSDRDAVAGGGGRDTVLFTSGGQVAATAFAQVSQVETVILAAAGNALALTDAMVAGAADGAVEVIGAAGNDRLDLAAVTIAANRVAFLAGTGADTLAGGGGADTFRVTIAALDGADSISGGSGAALDTLAFTSAGTVAGSRLAGVSGIERIVFEGGRGSVALSDALVGSADGSVMRIEGSTAGDRFDGSAVNAPNRMVLVAGGGGNDTLLGGAGADTIAFTVAELDNGDLARGGADIDGLQLSGGGTVDFRTLTAASGFEALSLDDADYGVTLSDAFIASATGQGLTFGAGEGATVLDLSSLSAPAGVTGDLGGGNDVLEIAAERPIGPFGGGAGFDELLVAYGAATTFAMPAGLTGFEFVGLSDADAASRIITFTANDQAGLIVGMLSGTDQADIRLGANGQRADGNVLADRVDGGSGGDTEFGHGGADSLYGRDGHDVLYGGDGNDLLDGGDGIDTVSYEFAASGVRVNLAVAAAQATGEGSDTIRDVENLSGSAFGDVLTGNGDDNRLFGDRGLDRVRGGHGADLFDFCDCVFEGTTATTADQILDFSQAQGDRIGLAAIDAVAGSPGNQAFGFIGSAGFSGTAGELRYNIAGSTTYVTGDIDGDAQLDFMIRLTGAITLTAGDFVL